MTSTQLVEVVAGVLVRPDGRFLLASRPVGKVYAGYWEFPGGKIEPGEAPYAALVRELQEELAITAEVIQQFRPQSDGFHELRSRRAGRRRHIDFHLTLPREMTVAESHTICDQIERAIEERLPYSVVLIHVEPEGHP